MTIHDNFQRFSKILIFFIKLVFFCFFHERERFINCSFFWYFELSWQTFCHCIPRRVSTSSL